MRNNQEISPKSVGLLIGLLVMGGVLMGTSCPSAPPGGIPTGQFAGSDACMPCHADRHSEWDETAHAKAFETLVASGNDTNPACLPCHTLGFGQEGGYVDQVTTSSLVGVQCEACHGASREHVTNVADVTKRPPKSIAASVCQVCHLGAHHPTSSEWDQAGHSGIDEHVAEELSAASSYYVGSCGQCHSGDVRMANMVADAEGTTVPDDIVEGLTAADMNGISCVVCHNPHKKTGNAADDSEPRDMQLRYPQVTSPAPYNNEDAAQDATRFNICGQCHHSRGRTWTATSRGPHHSVQANFYIGEMPVPAGTNPLVPSERSIHRFVPGQCSTCHMYRKDFVSEDDPAITGHSFAVNLTGCVASGCHPSTQAVNTDLNTLQTSVDSRLDAIAAALGSVSTWEYTSGGGPDAAGQAGITDTVKKVRFMYHYILSDGSLGVHNPQYVDALLDEAETLLGI